MLEPLPFIPYPYLTLPDESLSYEPLLYVAPDKLICTGNVTFKTKHFPLAKVLSEKFREQWSPEMADEMARRVIKEAKANLYGRDLFMSAYSLPTFAFPAMEQVYCGKSPLTGRDVTYGWPSGKLTRINQILYGYTVDFESCVLHVRHEETAMPGKVYHQLQFPIQ